MSCLESYLFFVIYICSGYFFDLGLYLLVCLVFVYNFFFVDWRNCDFFLCRFGLCEIGCLVLELVYVDYYILFKISIR